MRLFEFLKNQEQNTINEAIRSTEIDKVIGLFSSYLKKKGITTYSFAFETNVDGTKHISILSHNYSNNNFALTSWSVTDTAEIATIDFGNMDPVELLGKFIDGKTISASSSIDPKGSSHVQCLKIIELALKGGTTVSTLKKLIDKSKMYENSYSPGILLENLSEGLDDFLRGKQKSGETELDFLRRMRGNLSVKVNGFKKSNDDRLGEYNDMLDEIRNRITELSAEVGRGHTISSSFDLPSDPTEEDIDRATPEERFQDMNDYIKLVIKGIKPLALICGAPGVGKTFRIMKEVNKTHKLGNNLSLMKGRCTPQAIYTELWQRRNDGDLIVFDDCDDVFKDDVAINLIKAAFDSSEKRLVSWSTARPIVMDRELAEQYPDEAVYDMDKEVWTYPRIFEFKGGGIIITNFRAGQIDTAIRNRSLIADLDFTTKELLDLIKGIMADISPDKLSPEGKAKAYDYLVRLVEAGSPMEISIRSFTICAVMYESDGDEKAIERKIKEQMRLQSERGGKKY